MGLLPPQILLSIYSHSGIYNCLYMEDLSLRILFRPYIRLEAFTGVSKEPVVAEKIGSLTDDGL
ncbi:unnamed protein product [Larinioides sclopetarius]|uniref:Uncharacterized protein n=1 Tax=Larinioides sclopetarius TaxID=280406 RepID=A0AAV1Z9A3_9ARAC